MSYHSGNQMIDPYLLFEKAHLQPAMHIADLGCGRTGHIIFPAVKIIGDRGIIYGVDILKDVLLEIQKRVKMENLLNVQTVWSDLERVGHTAIPNRSLDVAFIVNCLCQSNDHLAILDEAFRLMKDKARLIVVDWATKGLTFGPTQDWLINFDQILNWAKERNLFLQEDFFAGPYHRGLVFYKND